MADNIKGDIVKLYKGKYKSQYFEDAKGLLEGLNEVSPSFCLAKWYSVSLHLPTGKTHSCYHPPAHNIPMNELMQSSDALHNTEHKKEMRRMMQNGERPRECEYCWKMEDMGKDAVSDRTFKSIIYTDDELQQAYEADANENTNLKTFEIAFDRVCNLACSYCNASFSTTWAKDIKNNGPYENLVSDGAGAFHQDGSWAQPYKDDEDNPYIQAFWKWWENGLSDSLQELRVTGGEPLMIPEHWNILRDLIADGHAKNIKLRYNTNGHPPSSRKAVNYWNQFKEVVVNFSIDGTEFVNNYIRHPSVWKDTYEAFLYITQELDKNHQTNIACAVQALNALDLTNLARWSRDANQVNNK